MGCHLQDEVMKAVISILLALSHLLIWMTLAIILSCAIERPTWPRTASDNSWCETEALGPATYAKPTLPFWDLKGTVTPRPKIGLYPWERP